MTPQKSAEEKFWEWFSQKSDEYYSGLDTNQEELFNEMSEQLEKVEPGLTFLFSGVDPDTKRRAFIISADGIRDYIPVVQKLVDTAPFFEKWEITAFRPRMPDTAPIELAGIQLGPEDIYFKAVDEGELVGLELYITNYDMEDNRYIGAAFLNLDNVLGEYDVMTRIGNIQLFKLETTENLLPLTKLAEIVDAKKQPKRVH